MQTPPIYNPQSPNPWGMPLSSSYPQNQSYIDPRGSIPYNMAPQPNFAPNYQQYYNQWSNAPYPPYYGTSRGPSANSQSVQYIDPRYQYDYDPRYWNNQDARYHQRIQSYNIPTGYSNRTGQLPRQVMKKVPNQINQVPLGPNHPPIKQIIYEQQPLNIPQSVRNIQYIPHLNRYMDYVEDRVKIPVEKYYTDYYEVEHVTDFVPRQYQDTVIEMVPEQIVRYRLEYVPVQRKIVHLPKNQIYDQNGLFKGVGNLSDKIQINEAAIGLANQAEKRASNQVSRTIYDKMNEMRGLDQSLVDAIGKDIENQNKMDPTINRNVYENLKNNLYGSPTLSGQDVGRTLYQQNKYNPDSPSRYGSSHEQYNYEGESMAYGRTANQLYQQQIYSGLNQIYPIQKSRASRRKTNFVTSDGYLPNYEQEIRNLGLSY